MKQKWALEGLMADVIECTVKKFVNNETERAVVGNGAWNVTCCWCKRMNYGRTCSWHNSGCCVRTFR